MTEYGTQFLKEVQELDFEESKIKYIRPGVAQTPFMLQWLIEGFLQSIPDKENSFVEGEEKEFQHSINSSSNPEKTIAYLERLYSLELAKVLEPKQDLTNATTSEKFQYVIEKINYVNDSEDYSFEEIVGAAMIGTEASIKYLYPVFKQCFPGLDPYRVKDEVFNFAMGYMINDFFTDLINRINKA